MGVPLILTTEKHGVGICEFHAVSTEPFLTRHLCMTMLLWTGAAAFIISLLELPTTDYAPWLWLCAMLFLVVQRSGLTCAESLLVVHDLGIQVTLFQPFHLLTHDPWHVASKRGRTSEGAPPSVGAQVKRTRYSGRVDMIFVERSRIEDVVINEGIGFAAGIAPGGT